MLKDTFLCARMALLMFSILTPKHIPIPVY